MFVIQPHLDDAVLGIGALMLRAGQPSCLVSAFAGTPERYPPLIMRPHDDRCGFSEGDDIMATRLAEDAEATWRLGWSTVRMPLLDEQYREERRSKADVQEFQKHLRAAWIAAGSPGVLWCPAAVNHPDHTWMRQQVVAFALPQRLELRVWLEPGYRTFYPDQAERVGRFMTDLTTEPVSWADARRKLDLIRCYRSQLNGIAALAVSDALSEEIWGRWSGASA